MRKLWIVSSAMLVAAVLFSSSPAAIRAQSAQPDTAAASDPAAEVPLPEGAGKKLLQQRCTVCHITPTSHKYPRYAWYEHIELMMSYGAVLNEEEYETLVDYMATHFAPDINVNSAGIPDLVQILEIPVAEATALVEFRDKAGKFKTFDDLKKVPGLDIAKLEPKKSRMLFD